MPSTTNDAQKKGDDEAFKLAGRQLTTGLTLLSKLNDVDYALFRNQIERIAYQFSWHNSILDHTATVPANVRNSVKYQEDVRNAYVLLTDRTDGHEVADVLKDVPLGAAQQGWRELHEHYHRQTHGGQEEAENIFNNATMGTTHSNIVQWCALVVKNGKDLKAVSPNFDESRVLTKLLSGLLHEFDSVKVLLEDKSGLTLAQAKKKLLDHAKTRGLSKLTKGGPRNVRNNTFNVDDDSGGGRGRGRGGRGRGGRGGRDGDKAQQNGQRPPQPDRECNLFARGHCPYGKKCIFNHPGEEQAWHHTWKPGDGPPSGSVNLVSEVKADFSFSVDDDDTEWNPRTIADVANFGRGKFTGNVDHDSDRVKRIQASERALYPRSVERKQVNPQSGLTVMGCLALLLAAVVTAASDYSKAVVATLRRPGWLWVPCAVVIVVMILPSAYASACPTLPPEMPTVCPNAFTVAAGSGSVPVELEWCSDSGTNRFVTNDERDFVPGTVLYHDTVVSVGGGNVTSPMQGTVLVKSLDHDQVISCTNVLLIRQCAKKLMPVSTFTAKGCKIAYGKDTVVLTDPKDKPILAGKLIGGLYYFRTQTIRSDSANTEPCGVYFGLKAGTNPSSQDFQRQLHEAHCAYGHMPFDKLRKMLGLKKGTGGDPPCEACSMAKSRKAKLQGVPHDRATSTLHRTFADLGFTGTNGFTFQLLVDDYDRVSKLDVLEDGKGECFASWLQYKGDLETQFYPKKCAIIRTDSEPCYQTQDWTDHCRSENVTHEQSSRYRHDQNGVVERTMGVIGPSFRCMMITGNAPKSDSPQ